MQTKEQRRAEFVLEKIKSTYPDNVPKNTANFFTGLPATILSNGLGQTMAFLLSKGEKKYEEAFEFINEWLIKDGKINDNDNDLEFLMNLSSIDQRKYIAAQCETLALLQWFKRYTRAFKEEELEHDEKS